MTPKYKRGLTRPGKRASNTKALFKCILVSLLVLLSFIMLYVTMYALDDPPDEVVPDEEATKPGVGLDSQSTRAPRGGHRLKGSAKTAELGKLNVAPAGLPVGSLYAVGDGVLSDGSPFRFSDLVGKVSLVVNVASK